LKVSQLNVSYALNTESVCRELDGQFLVYSSLSRETLVVHDFVYQFLLYAQNQGRSFQEILDFFESDKLFMGRHKSKEFIEETLESLINAGVVDAREVN